MNINDHGLHMTNNERQEKKGGKRSGGAKQEKDHPKSTVVLFFFHKKSIKKNNPTRCCCCCSSLLSRGFEGLIPISYRRVPPRCRLLVILLPAHAADETRRHMIRAPVVVVPARTGRRTRGQQRILHFPYSRL